MESNLCYFVRNCTKLTSCEAKLHIQNKDLLPQFVIIFISAWNDTVTILRSVEDYDKIAGAVGEYFVVARGVL